MISLAGKILGNKGNPRSPYSKGFTLFELLLVLLIIGLMAGFVLPKVGNNFSGLKLKSETKKVAAALRYARSKAVTENRIISAMADSETNRFIIFADSDEKESDYPGLMSEDSGHQIVINELPIVEEMKIRLYTEKTGLDDNAAKVLRFFPSGASTGGTFILEEIGGENYRLIVDDFSGAVVVKSGEGR